MIVCGRGRILYFLYNTDHPSATVPCTPSLPKLRAPYLSDYSAKVPCFFVRCASQAIRHNGNHSWVVQNICFRANVLREPTAFWMLRRFVLWYDKHLQQRPLLVKAISSGLIVGLSDVCIQTFMPEHEKGPLKSRIDWQRTAIIGVGYGALWFTPVLHFITTGWARVYPSQTLQALAIKTTIDMTFAFPMNVSMMLGLQSLSRDGHKAEPLAAIKSNLWPSLKEGWKFWPTMTMIMYGVIPLHYRVLFLNSGSFGWNAFMIYRFQPS